MSEGTPEPSALCAITCQSLNGTALVVPVPIGYLKRKTREHKCDLGYRKSLSVLVGTAGFEPATP